MLTTKWLALLLVPCGALLFSGAREASAQGVAVTTYAPAVPVVSYYGYRAGLFGQRVVYRPRLSYAAAPVTTYYSPAPVTTYYAPAPVTSYYGAAPVTSYYAPSPLAPAPVTSYYAPAIIPAPVYRLP